MIDDDQSLLFFLGLKRHEDDERERERSVKGSVCAVMMTVVGSESKEMAEIAKAKLNGNCNENGSRVSFKGLTTLTSRITWGYYVSRHVQHLHLLVVLMDVVKYLMLPIKILYILLLT